MARVVQKATRTMASRAWPLVLGMLGMCSCSGDISGSRSQGDDGVGGEGGGGSGASGGQVGQNCRVSAPLRRLTKLQYENSIKAAFDGRVTVPSQFPIAELGSSRTGFSTEPDANVITKLGAENVLDGAEDVALQVAAKVGDFVGCAASANEACATQFIDKFASRLYRRPLQAEERTTLLNVFKKAEGADAFKDGIALVTATLLQSPQFLYLAEIGSPTNDEKLVKLSSYEVASRLSFLLWDGPPDEALLAAAADNKLDTPEQLREQTERMLGDNRAKGTLARFVKEWLSVSPVKAADRVGSTEALANAQAQEMEMFVQDAFAGSAKLKDFFTTRRTFLNKTAASSYGLDAAGMTDATWKEVTLDQAERAGILTLPAIMTSKAHPDEPAYVLRGAFILKKMMCVDFPNPPADAAQMLPAFPANATQREKSELIRKQEKCTGCHRMIDPIGLAFEAFDQLGRVRDKWPDGRAVNTTGRVDGVSEDLDGDFQSPRHLAERMANSAEVANCVAKQAFRFAYAKLESDADTCALDALAGQWRDRDLTLRELWTAMTSAQGFRFRELEDVK